MERTRKLRIAKTAVVALAIPLIVWAYEYGPDPGFAGVPGENGGATCTAVGCHAGTANSFTTGSVKVTFPDGLTYAPGVKQHLQVTIADTAPTQRLWGFQLTARLASNTGKMAGTFASTDQFTTLMCSQTNLFIFQESPFSAA